MDNTHENPVAGIRSWLVDYRGLVALHQEVPWRREMRSECVLGHTEPVFGCQCGLWARYSLEGWEAREGLRRYGTSYFIPTRQVVGVVSSAGCKIIRGETGFRAGEMRIEALIEYHCKFEALGTTVSLLPALRALADGIGVPVITPDEIEMFCDLEGYELMAPLVGEDLEEEAGTDQASGGVINNSTSSRAFADAADLFRQLAQATKAFDAQLTPQQATWNLLKRKGFDQLK